ncbi:FecR domain-containing protein [Thauera linaloolentis]|uniref:Fe2+-dicitrate sensor n=1 Tax=Thauera linaloolentis (strain DSM 12138 / JCM 21573 / CCUG 41526 / CIP 105981 / IAM 15112 / NBRC 102519 / 47Lol) TaxID=1123367 RepID=N6Y882_THAL4|nr:FecR domain-containing protein [Thauera linaloolentis]ENO90471.1 Fe2+-dicitrate sensor [Thauera linaloolentis 47Lol = DSM 12138]MCM8566332.1 FecR domain-containing protein [Thauera linaloolentis]
MKRPPPISPIPADVLDEAADWLLLMQEGGADRDAFEQWRARSPEHGRAWERAEALLGKLGALPPALALPTLGRPAARGRRALLAKAGKLAVLLALLPAGWNGWRMLERKGLGADYRTAAGEQREILLEDGTRLTLNTATALDVHASDTARSILLRAGEILVHTGHGDTAGRPLHVVTPHGIASPIGTRFSVRLDEAGTRVAVLEGQVRIAPAATASTQILRPGEQLRFARDTSGPVTPAGDNATAWTRGMLLADDMPLGELVAELSRYRMGVIQCHEAVAALRISGAFPVGSAASTERSLAMLAGTHPLDISSRLGGLWISVDPRN